MPHFAAIDIFAFIWFWIGWIGYSYFADSWRSGGKGLFGLTHRYRREWMRQTLKRDNRMVDAALIRNLMTSVTFFASTTIYIIAGLLAIMGTVNKAISFASDLPFMHETSQKLWEIKLLLLLIVFVYAYFKFTWSLRQFNFLSILMGGAPPVNQPAEQQEIFISKAAQVNSLAGDEFNRGLRAYYFALGILAWFVHPWAFIVATALVVVVLLRRDYASHIMRILRVDPPEA